MNPVLLLTMAVAIIGSNSLLLSPLAAPVAQGLGVRPSDVLMASAAYGAATAVSALLLAYRADRVGLGRALIWSLAGLTAGLVLSALAPSVWGLIAAQALAGIAGGVCLPVVYGMAAELAPPGRAAHVMGRVLTGWTLSLVLGVSLSALLADIVHWRVVYAGIAALSGAVTLAALPLRRVVGAGAADSSPLTALRVPGIGPGLASVGCFMAAFYGLYAYLGTHMQAVLGLPTAKTALAVLAYGAGFGGISLFDRQLDRLGANRVAPVIFALLIAVYLAIGSFSGWAGGLIALCLLWGAVNHFGLNILVGRLTALQPSQRGAIMGLYSTATYGAMFVGTLGLKPLFVAHGFAACSYAAATFVLLPLLVSLRINARASGLSG